MTELQQILLRRGEKYEAKVRRMEDGSFTVWIPAEKGNAPQRWHANGAEIKITQEKYSTKRRLSKAQKAMLKDIFGVLVLTVMMALVVLLMLIVG